MSVKSKPRRIKVALVGRYVELPDAYMSVSAHHAGVYHNVSVEIAMISAQLDNGSKPEEL